MLLGRPRWGRVTRSFHHQHISTLPKVLVDFTEPTIRIDGHLCRTKACVSGCCQGAEAAWPIGGEKCELQSVWGAGRQEGDVRFAGWPASGR